jgi:L,D-transpeptidase catalytic domain
MARRNVVAFVLLLASASGFALPFWGAKASRPDGTPPDALKPGEYVWAQGVAPDGPIVVIVSLTEQRAYVYRNGVEIGYSTVSTGRPGHVTPTGIFTILQKDKNHHSSIYHGAPMPDQERLTWDGVALHAGGLPGYPESHGCVHLPSQFADDLFRVTHLGMTVIIVNDKTAPADVVHPGALVPISATSGEADIQSRLAAGEKWRWEPEKSPDGPVSMMVSLADQRMIVLRNGIEIGRSRIFVSDPGTPVGTHAFMVKAGEGSGESVLLQGAAARNWMEVPMPGYAGSTADQLGAAVGGRVRLPQDFAKLLYPLLVPGTTLLVTDAPMLEENTGRSMTVMGAGNPNLTNNETRHLTTVAGQS